METNTTAAGPGPDRYLSASAAALGVALGSLALASAAAAAERRRLAGAAAPGYARTLETELRDRAEQLTRARAAIGGLRDDGRALRREVEQLRAQNQRLADAATAAGSVELAELVARWNRRADDFLELDGDQACAGAVALCADELRDELTRERGVDVDQVAAEREAVAAADRAARQAIDDSVSEPAGGAGREAEGAGAPDGPEPDAPGSP
jgi:hypothetical protein